jgi:hypothetical protein
VTTICEIHQGMVKREYIHLLARAGILVVAVVPRIRHAYPAASRAVVRARVHQSQAACQAAARVRRTHPAVACQVVVRQTRAAFLGVALAAAVLGEGVRLASCFRATVVASPWVVGPRLQVHPPPASPLAATRRVRCRQTSDSVVSL